MYSKYVYEEQKDSINRRTNSFKLHPIIFRGNAVCNQVQHGAAADFRTTMIVHKMYPERIDESFTGARRTELRVVVRVKRQLFEYSDTTRRYDLGSEIMYVCMHDYIYYIHA